MDSIFPCTKYLTFAPWIYLVPQYKPENVLMLGYAGGTAAGLIRKLYGDLPITAVDIELCVNNYGVKFVQADAAEFVKDCEQFDCVIVDIFLKDTLPDFLKSGEFVTNLKRIANYLIINTDSHLDMTAYQTNFVSIGALQACGNKIFYFMRPGLDLELTPPIG